jgi:transposase
MRQSELHLSGKDRRLVCEVRAKGLHHSREVNRAHILAALDRRVPESQIMEVLGVGRTAIWRTRKAYLEGGLQWALHDAQRPGKPRRYGTDVEAQVTALACSAPPAGAKRWTLDLLEQVARRQSGMEGIGRQTIRRLLKKTASSLGAD